MADTTPTRYILELDGDQQAWLFEHDHRPSVLPLFSGLAEDEGLVCAHLVRNELVAEVVVSPAHIAEVCGNQLPTGRLYFQIPKSELYMVCPSLTPAAFEGAA